MVFIASAWSHSLKNEHVQLSREMTGQIFGLNLYLYTPSKAKHHLYFCWNNFNLSWRNFIEHGKTHICCETLHKYLNENFKNTCDIRILLQSAYQNFSVSTWNFQEVNPNILKQILCLFHTKFSTFIHVDKIAMKIKWPLCACCRTPHHIL